MLALKLPDGGVFALQRLELHLTSRGIDIPQPFYLPPSLAVEQPLLLPAHYSEGLKKAAGGVKIARPALPRLEAACWPAAAPEYQQDPPPSLASSL